MPGESQSLLASHPHSSQLGQVGAGKLAASSCHGDGAVGKPESKRGEGGRNRRSTRRARTLKVKGAEGRSAGCLGDPLGAAPGDSGRGRGASGRRDVTQGRQRGGAGF